MAGSPAWRRLLHIHRHWPWGERSDIKDSTFFAAPRGWRDPSAELNATLAVFFEPPMADTTTQQAQCRYPARYTWLKEQLHFDPAQLPERPCPRFEAWASHMNAGSLTLVFASYYMNNPSSMYGHPFLRLNPSESAHAPPLLDYTISYAAEVTTTNDFLFPFYGLAGVYSGRFSTMPYYMKVREYTDMESRDLWEYELTLDSAAVHRMVQHVWELGQAAVPYYFFTKNCAYEVLPLLEVADPRLDLSRGFRFKAIPVDILRTVREQPGLVRSVQERPSFVTQLIARRARLDASEVHLAEGLSRAPTASFFTPLAGEPVQRQALVLDSAYDYFRYRAGFYRDQPASNEDAGERLLRARNQLGAVRTPPLEVPSEESPDQGHPSGRLGLAYGFSNHSHFEELGLRAAIHDQDDPPKGYLPGSELEMFNLRLRYDTDRSTVYIREFTLVNILSLSPLDRWVRHPSWTIKTGLDSAEDLGRDPENSLYYGLTFGSGFAVPAGMGRGSLLYALAKVDAGLGSPFQQGYRAGGGGEAGLMFTIARFWRVHLSAGYTRYPVGNITGRNVLKLVQGCPLRKNLEARVTIERQNNYREVLAGLMLYL